MVNLFKRKRKRQRLLSGHATREEAFTKRTRENVRNGMRYAVSSGSVSLMASARPRTSHTLNLRGYGSVRMWKA